MASAILELKILAGAESKQFLFDLEKLVSRMEKASGKATAKTESEEEEDLGDDDEDLAPKKASKGKKPSSLEDDESEEEETTQASEDDEDEDLAPKKSSKGKKTSSFEDDESEEEEAEEEEDEAPKQKAKSKSGKVTLDDVNDACMERAGRTNRAEVLSILKKKFGVKTVSKLSDDQYPAVIKAMKAK